VALSFEEAPLKTTPRHDAETEAYVYGAEADTIVMTAATDETGDSNDARHRRLARRPPRAGRPRLRRSPTPSGDLLAELRDKDIRGSRLEGLFDG